MNYWLEQYSIIGLIWAAIGYAQKGKDIIDDLRRKMPMLENRHIAGGLVLGYFVMAAMWPIGMIMSVKEWWDGKGN